MVRGSIAVLDYGMGNLHSVASALEYVGASQVIVSNDPSTIAEAERVVFPGVGGIRDCMEAIRRLECDKSLASALNVDRKPTLAICVGMQALMSFSEENDGVACLGWVEGDVRHFGEFHQDAEGKRLKVPHMGWNRVSQTTLHPLWSGIEQNTRFYFVHSYHTVPVDSNLIVGAFDYGFLGCAAIARDNLFATQFHPEKSHKAGLRLLSNFLSWNGKC